MADRLLEESWAYLKEVRKNNGDDIMARFSGSITDVKGIKVGQAQNQAALTGVTVVRAGDEGAVLGVDVRGAAPGTRETDLARPGNLVKRANAVALCGGSAFGLAAADGVMRYLESINVGLDMGACHVPIVPAAVLFDLGVGDPKTWPDAKMGEEACRNANTVVKEGRVGAGCGATIAKLVPGSTPCNGGVGTASIKLSNGVTVGAIAAVNAVGDVYHPHSSEVVDCASLADGTKVTAMDLLYGSAPTVDLPKISGIGQNTTIAVIATDAKLSKEQANRLATVAHDGIARVIIPAHTQLDGDTIFALATGRVDNDFNFIQICMAASEVMARAIYNGSIAANK